MAGMPPSAKSFAWVGSTRKRRSRIAPIFSPLRIVLDLPFEGSPRSRPHGGMFPRSASCPAPFRGAEIVARRLCCGGVGQAERLAGGGGGHTGVDRGNDVHQDVEHIIADTGRPRFFDAIAGADLAPSGHGHGQADEVLLSLGQKRRVVGLAQVSDDLGVVIGHAEAPRNAGNHQSIATELLPSGRASAVTRLPGSNGNNGRADPVRITCPCRSGKPHSASWVLSQRSAATGPPIVHGSPIVPTRWSLMTTSSSRTTGTRPAQAVSCSARTSPACIPPDAIRPMRGCPRAGRA